MSNVSNPPSNTDFQDLRLFFQKLQSVAGAVSGVVTVLPLSGLVWNAIVPPWPDGENNRVLIAGAVVTAILTVLGLFFAFRNGTAQQPLSWVRCFLVLGGISALLFILLTTFCMPTVGDEVHVTGLSLRDEARQAVERKDVDSDVPKDLLDYFGHESEGRIWYGHTLVTFTLVVLFLVTPALIAGGFSLFVLSTLVEEKLAAAQSSAASTSTT